MKIDGRKNTDSTNLNNNNTLEYTKYCGTYTVVVKNEDRFIVAIIAENVSKEEAQAIINEYLVSDKEVVKEVVAEDKAITINDILAVKPQFILAVNYDAGSIGEMVGEDRDLNLYIADMTIQYHSLVDDACLSFTSEYLVSVNDGLVAIEDTQTGADNESVYINNIVGLPNGSYYVNYDDNGNSDLRDVLHELIQDQPIYDIPAHYTIEAY